MDPLSIAAASGMRARLESLDLLANNLANATTVGYKGDREFYNLYTSAEASADASQVPDADQAEQALYRMQLEAKGTRRSATWGHMWPTSSRRPAGRLRRCWWTRPTGPRK